MLAYLRIIFTVVRFLCCGAVLLAGHTSVAEDGSQGSASPGRRRDPKPWWKPASREQALSWVVLVAAIAAAAAGATGAILSREIQGATTTTAISDGFQVLPLDTFTSNLAGKLNSGDYAFVQYGGGAANGRRRLAAATGNGVFRISNATSGLSSATPALTLTSANGATLGIAGTAIGIQWRGSALLLSAHSNSTCLISSAAYSSWVVVPGAL